MSSFQTLISASQLLALEREHAALLIVECSFDLADTDAGERFYLEGHIPGARYLHLDRDLSGAKTGTTGRHPLPDREAFAAKLRAIGLNQRSQVVAYDRQGGPYAARVWWMLRWLGLANVAVLDGGLAAWTAAGGPLSQHLPPEPQAGDFTPGPALTQQIDADTLLKRLGQVRLIDARAAERFRGEVEPLDARAGHIPGASNRFFKDNLDTSGAFKPAAQLRSEFETVLGGMTANNTVQQCGSGVTACHNLLAMVHAGLGESALYPGSWSEWSGDPARPCAKG
ncbi:MAG TPA: sulfurtransferase [Burkholderiaceae bacterium]